MVLFDQKTLKRTSEACHPRLFRVFLVLFGQKTLKQAGITNLGFPGMTSLGFPGLSFQSVMFSCGLFRPKGPETDLDDKPWLPRLVIPFRFGCFLALFEQENPKQTGMTSLVFQSLSSQSVSGLCGPLRHKTPKWTEMTSLGFPCRSVLLWPLSALKHRNGLGLRQAWVSWACHTSPFRVFWAVYGQKTQKLTGGTSLGFPGLSCQSVSGFFTPFPARKSRNGLG